MVEEQTPNTPQTPIEHTVENPMTPEKKVNWMKIVIGIFFGAVLLIIGALLGGRQLTQDKPIPLEQGVIPTSAPQPTAPVKEPTQVINSDHLIKFTDSRVENMAIDYDPQVWTFSEIAGIPDQQDTFPGILLTNEQGTLTIRYGISLGVGGGLSLFEDNIFTKVSQNLGRLRQSEYNPDTNLEEITNRYVYGIARERANENEDGTVYLFQAHPDEKQRILGYCNEEGNFPGLTVESCADLKAGSVVGISYHPNFDWSVTRQRIASLESLFPDITNEEIASGAYSDIDTIILHISYDGARPEEADKIVRQLVQ